MLRRIEVYADAALLSFPFALVLLLAFSALRFVGGSILIVPVSLIGGALAIWTSWVLHHKTTSQPLPADERRTLAWATLGIVVAATVLAVLSWAVGVGWTITWMTASVFVAAVAVALLADSIIDLVRTRMHKTIDVLRIVLLGFLGFAWASSGLSADVGVWVVIVGAYMIGVALVAFAWDVIAAHRAQGSETPSGLAPSA